MPGFAAAEYCGQIEFRDPQSSIEITAQCSPPHKIKLAAQTQL